MYTHSNLVYTINFALVSSCQFNAILDFFAENYKAGLSKSNLYFITLINGSVVSQPLLIMQIIIAIKGQQLLQQLRGGLLIFVVRLRMVWCVEEGR